MEKIVLLYNDQDVETVRQIRRALRERMPDAEFWIADEDLTAKDSLVGGIVNKIRTASGVAIFLGPRGLGRFQKEIELEAVWLAIRERGIRRLAVHLGANITAPDYLLESIVPVNRHGELTDPSALAVEIIRRFDFGEASAATAEVAPEKVLFLYDSSDRSDVRRIQASLRRKLDQKKFVLYSQDNLSSFGEPPDLLMKALTEAWGVFVVVGADGPGAELAELAQGAARQAVVDQGGKQRRATILLHERKPDADLFPGWKGIAAPDPLNYDAVAEDLVEALHCEACWTLEVAIKTAITQFGDAKIPQKRFSEVARSLTEGKPLTLLLGPYAVPEAESCPSRVRQALLELLRDQPLYKSLVGPGGDLKNEFVPALWTDHLATLCLLADCDRDKIAATIGDVVSAHEGDAEGKPAPLFRQVADFAQQLRRYGPPRSPGLPAVTVLTVCPGLRMERALVSRGCAFERVTMLFGSDGWQRIDQKIYRPDKEDMKKATDGAPDYLPEAQTLQPGDDQQAQFVRLVKLGGSRDLADSMVVDFGQGYRMMAESQTRLAPFVSAAGMGPYLAMGAGLATPPLQAAHALLLRTALQNALSRPQLALIGNSAQLPDPLWQAEMGRLATLTQTPQSGFERIELVDGAPEVFIQALSVAFSGAPERAP